jgi:hypothetical protein
MSPVPTNWADARNPLFDRNIQVVKAHMNICGQALSLRQKVDEAYFRLNTVDTWPKLEERLEKARLEARRLRAERLGVESE